MCHVSCVPWSLWIVHSERTTARSSAHSPMCGTSRRPPGRSGRTSVKPVCSGHQQLAVPCDGVDADQVLVDPLRVEKILVRRVVDRLAGVLVQLRLEVEALDVADAAAQEDPDDALGARRADAAPTAAPDVHRQLARATPSRNSIAPSARPVKPMPVSARNERRETAAADGAIRADADCSCRYQRIVTKSWWFSSTWTRFSRARSGGSAEACWGRPPHRPLGASLLGTRRSAFGFARRETRVVTASSSAVGERDRTCSKAAVTNAVRIARSLFVQARGR